MAHVYKAEEWSSNGKWLCGDVSALAAGSNSWWYVPQILGLSYTDYIHELINTYHAVDLLFSAKSNVLIFYFSTLADCRKFKNKVNKIAREKNFITY